MANSSARQQIFANIRKAQERSGMKPDPELVAARLKDHPMGIIPTRSKISKSEQIDLFEKMAKNVQATVARLSGLDQLPEAVADYLKDRNLPARVKLSGDERLKLPDWKEKTRHIALLEGASEGDDLVSLSMAFKGIAETGSLMLYSGPAGPTTLNFLPETHMVVVFEKDIVGAYEEAFQQLRDHLKSRDEAYLPRTVNLITGPSRTGDIEQTILLGAHGPHALHIMLVGDE